MKKWLLREQPEEKLDLRLWQTFRNIDLQTAIKLHEEQPAAKLMGTSQSQANLPVMSSSNESERASVSSTTFVLFYLFYMKLFIILFIVKVNLMIQLGHQQVIMKYHPCKTLII